MIALAPTDLDWFFLLRDGRISSEINFWTPTPWNVQLPAGTKFYFLLKARYRKIAGCGSFLRYENRRASDAWESCGRAKGVENFVELIPRAGK